MPMAIKRDDSGFLDFEKIKIKDYEMVSESTCFTFTYRGNRYYFRPARQVEYVYNELIAYEIAKDFGIDAVPYDLAYVNGQIGNISKDFFEPGMVHLEDMLKSFYGTDHNKCNLSDVEFMLQEIYSTEVAKKIGAQLIDLLMFDLIIGNADRHDRNIIINEREEKL